MESNRSYRIRTEVGKNETYKIDVPLTQTYDMFEILSLKLKQNNQYKFYDADYGVLVGRILANQGFGIPNAKISIFIEVDSNETNDRKILYNFTSTRDTNYNGVRYNLLPDFVDNACHQDVGTFPNKRLVLDNQDVLEVFEKYYKYTTTTNNSGDFMLYGVPTGMQNLHVDIDLSDIGVLSQRPRDMVYKGYNINQFESPNKFKQSTNLNSLSQIYTQDKGVYVYPYWGNSNNGEETVGITRCDINIDYTFEPTAIFMGSVITDKGNNAIGKNCTGTDNLGKMSDLATGEGSIEMIRKTVDNKVEEFSIKGNRLIDGDGVWCYQVPMNLDYITTNEFGETVPTDNPSKGIPTRARVRFRITMDESVNDGTARKRCRYLVPNNPRYDEIDYPEFYKTGEADYEFGSLTKDENYCDMFWNNVYTVKNYIPRLQKNRNVTNRKHTGIKLINHYGDNNPMPYNSLDIKLSFTYRLICVLTKVIIFVIATINQILGLVMEPICWIANTFKTIAKGLCFSILGIKPLCWLGSIFKLIGDSFEKMVVPGIQLGSEFCDDGINRFIYYPCITQSVIGCVIKKWKNNINKEQKNVTNIEEIQIPKVVEVTKNNTLITCIENQLAQNNDATSFNFQNDWINGVLYFPLWYRKITPKKSFFFGLFKKKAKDQWCSADKYFGLLNYQSCALDKTNRFIVSPLDGLKYPQPTSVLQNCGENCHKKVSSFSIEHGLILTRENLLGQTLYYYKAVENSINENNNDNVKLLFATDIVLLGSLNDCDIQGIPQFFKNLTSSTFNLPTDILFTDTTITVDANGEPVINENSGDIVFSQFSEATGCDWGNLNSYDECGEMGKDIDGGLFYGIGCSSIEMTAKSCLNLSRICEFGVTLDERKFIPNLDNLEDESNTNELTPDGFISFDELANTDERSMFATLNGNALRTKMNIKTGYKEYDLRYLYPNNFDGLLKPMMRRSGKSCNYINNHNLEEMSDDYYIFRMGVKPYFYDKSYSMPRYENSFYFYFGLKQGKTAIEKFNSQFFAECESTNNISAQVGIEIQPNSWCSDDTKNADGYMLINTENVSKPFDIIISSKDDTSYNVEFYNLDNDKIFIGDTTNVKYKEFVVYDIDYVAEIIKDDGKEYVEGKEYQIYIKDDKKCFFKVGDKEYEIAKNTNGNIIKFDNVKYKIHHNNIKNGVYEITIIESDGNIINTEVSMQPPKVSFEYETYHSDFSNSERETKGDGLMSYLLNGNHYINDGCYIRINKVTQDGTFYIHIEPHEMPSNNVILNNFYDTCKIIVKNGLIEDCTNLKQFKDNDPEEENNFIIYDNVKKVIEIVCPYGGYYYDVTIVQVCEKENTDFIFTNNSQTISVLLNDAIPYKMYINSIDVAVFKGEQLKVGIGSNIDSLNLNNMTGWDELLNEKNYSSFFNEEYINGYDEYINEKEVIETDYNNAKDNVNPNNDNYDSHFNQLKQQILNYVNSDYIIYENKKYDVIDNKVTIGEVSYDVIDNNSIINKLNNYFNMMTNLFVIIFYDVIDNKVTIGEVSYDVIDNKVTIGEVSYDVIEVIKIDNIFYDVIDNKVTIGEVSYDVIDNKVTIGEVSYDVIEVIKIDNEGRKNVINSTLKVIQNEFFYVEGIDGILQMILNDYEVINTNDELTTNLYNSFKNDFYKELREAFVFTSEESKDINIRVQTNSVPVIYHLYYNEEEEFEDENGDYSIIINKLKDYKKDQDINLINSVSIPTLTNKDDIYYGYDGSVAGYIKGELSFGYDKINEQIKKLYGVRVENNRGSLLPLDDNANAVINSQNYFFFHLINKVLRTNFRSWSYFNNIPYINNNNEEYINFDGFVSGIIFNGILNDDKKFNECKFNNKIFEIETDISTPEWKIPTKRYIKNDYKKEQKYKGLGHNYLLIPNKETNLRIIDEENNYINEVIYGNLSLSVENCEEINEEFIVDLVLNNAPYMGSLPTFYAVKINDFSDYPLYMCYSYNINENKYIMDLTKNNIFNYTYNLDNLLEEETHNFEIKKLDDEGNDNGYEVGNKTNTPSFKVKKETKLFYIIAKTYNNCCTISPLYNLKSVKGKVTLIAVFNYKNEGLVKMQLVDNGSENEYIKLFPSTYISVVCEISENEQTNTNKKIAQKLKNEIVVDLNNSLLSIVERASRKKKKGKAIGQNLNIYLTDVTGIPHYVQFSQRKTKNKYKDINFTSKYLIECEIDCDIYFESVEGYEETDIVFNVDNDYVSYYSKLYDTTTIGITKVIKGAVLPEFDIRSFYEEEGEEKSISYPKKVNYDFYWVDINTFKGFGKDDENDKDTELDDRNPDNYTSSIKIEKNTPCPLSTLKAAGKYFKLLCKEKQIETPDETN